jgi:hypothetical protein
VLISQELCRIARWSVVLGLASLIAGCGGGGDGPSDFPTPSPTVSLTTSATAIAQGAAATLTWSSTNATACTASQGWSGSKPTSGSESTGALSATTTFTLACTGAGGSATQSITVTAVPPPTLTLNATPTVVNATGTSVLTWSSTNATSCSASGGWSGARAAAGAEDMRPLIADSTFTLVCTGIGGTTAPQSVLVTVNPPPAGSAIVSGKIQFERVPFDTVLGNGLDPDNPVTSPARGVVVEALPSVNGSPLAMTSTNALGEYAFVLQQNTNAFLRAKAQLLRAGGSPTWNFRVLNNTNGALLALDRPVAIGTTNIADYNLTASTGWNGSSYATDRAAAPFAILDTVYDSMQLIRLASGTLSFPALDLYWSPENRPASPLCPSIGQIGTTSYTTGGNFEGACEPIAEGIYVLGAFDNGNGDTDEFDRHVIAHEFGHYVETQFSRSDSIGGPHGDADKLDLRVAFGEGWGNAFSAMALNDPVYRDSFDGISEDFSFNVEQDAGGASDGWFSESSIGEILWDLFDSTNESGDTVSLGFGPIFAALTNGQQSTSALTSIFSFLDALRDETSDSSGINQLRNGESISGTDEFGAGESNSGGDASTLPVYRSITLNGGQQSVCVRATNGAVNKLGYNKFFRLDIASAALVTITVIGAVDPSTSGSVSAQDPDIYVHRQGNIVVSGVNTGSSETISQVPLPAGTYILEVQDFELKSGNIPRCMTISVSGA